MARSIAMSVGIQRTGRSSTCTRTALMIIVRLICFWGQYTWEAYQKVNDRMMACVGNREEFLRLKPEPMVDAWRKVPNIQMRNNWKSFRQEQFGGPGRLKIVPSVVTTSSSEPHGTTQARVEDKPELDRHIQRAISEIQRRDDAVGYVANDQGAVATTTPLDVSRLSSNFADFFDWCQRRADAHLQEGIDDALSLTGAPLPYGEP